MRKIPRLSSRWSRSSAMIRNSFSIPDCRGPLKIAKRLQATDPGDHVNKLDLILFLLNWGNRLSKVLNHIIALILRWQVHEDIVDSDIGSLQIILDCRFHRGLEIIPLLPAKPVQLRFLIPRIGQVTRAAKKSIQEKAI